MDIFDQGAQHAVTGTEPETTTTNEVAENQDSVTETIHDLEQLGKFKFNGREWTAGDLKNSIMRQDDYSRKTQELAQERKYWNALDSDLRKVMANPSLSEEFLRVYPKQFHYYLERILEKQKQVPQSASANEDAMKGIPQELLEKINRLESHIQNTEVEKIDAQLESKFAGLSKKYPMADEGIVISRAQSLLDKGVRLTDDVWEKLWKNTHMQIDKKIETLQKQKLETQRTANNKSREPGSGGGIPGQAPRRETFDEATERAVRELSRR